MAKERIGSNLHLGSWALLAGVVTALVTVLGLILRRKKRSDKGNDHYDGWGETLGV